MPSTPGRFLPGQVVTAADASLDPLRRRRVAVIGYGTMGRAHALNLQQSGIDVTVGLRPSSTRRERAEQEGCGVVEVTEAVAHADVVMLMLPDEAMAAGYTSLVAPALAPDTALGFAHGFAVAFDQITPEPGRPCFLVAPKAQGDLLRESFAAGGGFPGLIAVTESSPAETWDLATAYALAVGCLHGGGMATTFRAECVSDQFGEQVVLCGGVIELLKAAFDVLTERGYAAENAYLECVHELKLITDLLHRYGIDGMRQRISGTAAYGGLTRGPRIIDETVRRRLATILDEIETGAFAREFLTTHDDDRRGTAALISRETDTRLVRTGRDLAQGFERSDTTSKESGK